MKTPIPQPAVPEETAESPYESADELNQRLIILVQGLLIVCCGYLGAMTPQRFLTTPTTGLSSEPIGFVKGMQSLPSLLVSITDQLYWAALGLVVGIVLGVLVARLAKALLSMTWCAQASSPPNRTIDRPSTPNQETNDG